MIRIEVEQTPLEIGLDLRRVAEHLAIGMRDYWADQLDDGLQADGSPLPLNEEGKPLGRGKGTFVRNWKLRTSRTRGRGRATVEPFKGGKYRAAWFVLAARGVMFMSFAGAAEQAWGEISSRVVRDELWRMLAEQGHGARRRRSRRKVVSWEEKQASMGGLA
jgi:hypothetical protein